jgi:hypothetical protein
MSLFPKTLALALFGAFAIVAFESPAEAREPALKKARHVQKAPARPRVAHRTHPPAPVAAAGGYGVPADARAPYGGPGRAQFEPLVIGAQPDRSEGRSPEGP